MNQYIITEELLEKVIRGDIIALREVRSRPYNPQAEREKVLDDFALWDDTRYVFHAVQDYKRKLRQEGNEENKKLCSECGRPLDLRGKCHECLNDQFLNEEYDAYSEMNKDGE